jgi:hypothetical protein
MKYYIFIIVFIFACSCNQQQPKESINTLDSSSVTNLAIDKAEVLELAKNYLIKITPTPKLFSDNENIFIYNGEPSNGETENDDYYAYTIPKNNVIIGDLNGDNKDDAEVHLVKSYGGNAASSEQLIFLNQEGKLILLIHEVNHSELIFESIKDGVLYGIVYSRDEDFNIVTQKVKYQLIANKLVEIE